MIHPRVRYPMNADTPTSPLPFSPCVVVGELVFVSGQASVDQSGQIVADTFEGEFRRSIENLAAVLKTAGTDLAHVVQTRNYIRDESNYAEYNKLYAEYFPTDRPARTSIVKCLGDELRYELECIAVLPADK